MIVTIYVDDKNIKYHRLASSETDGGWVVRVTTGNELASYAGLTYDPETEEYFLGDPYDEDADSTGLVVDKETRDEMVAVFLGMHANESIGVEFYSDNC